MGCHCLLQGLPKDPEILLLSIYPPQKEKNTNVKRYLHTNVIAILFKIAKIWKHKCPSTDKWIKRDVVYTYTVEYCSDIKKNEILLFATIWMDLELH